MQETEVFRETESLCSQCKQMIPAKIVFRDREVIMEKSCIKHGNQTCLLSSSIKWYLDCLTFSTKAIPPKSPKKIKQGCPFDCGPCEDHRQKVYLPVLPITSACNLDCPICYTINRNRDPYQMSNQDLVQILDHLLEEHHELDIINFTGGEPTLNPHLLDFIQICNRKGIRRVTISTNGIRLRDEAYVRKLAALNARIVLSLDSFDPETDRLMLGLDTVTTKLAVLDLLEKHDVSTTLLPAVAKGVNDKDVTALYRLMIDKPQIRSLELHTLTFTGQGGVGFNRSARITTPDLISLVGEASNGIISEQDFVPSPLAHPHCYAICYMLRTMDGQIVPFTRLASRQVLFDLLSDSLYIEPRQKLETVFHDMINELWANPDQIKESQTVLKTLKHLLKELFPSRPLDLVSRQKIAEKYFKAIYIHSHMDEESFEVDRIKDCCVGVPDTDGSNIPTCSYNILYREKDSRFTDENTLEHLKRRKLSQGNAEEFKVIEV